MEVYFLKQFPLDLPGRQLFYSISAFLDFIFILSIKNWPYRLPKGFVICDVTRINITEEVLPFTPNQTYTEITLFIVCLSINVTFLRRDLLMISLFIFLFMKGAWFTRTYRFLWEHVFE